MPYIKERTPRLSLLFTSGIILPSYQSICFIVIMSHYISFPKRFSTSSTFEVHYLYAQLKELQILKLFFPSAIGFTPFSFTTEPLALALKPTIISGYFLKLLYFSLFIFSISLQFTESLCP